MQINYQYFLDYCEKWVPPNGRVLDFGCGKGEMVVIGRSNGLDFYGADVFYKDGKTRLDADRTGLLGREIKEIVDGKLDFPDGYFDMVVSNQVFEHVKDLDQSLREIKRVTKPGGVLHTLFPVKDTWWEGHFGIFFLHKFPRDSFFRVGYARAWRLLGLGYHQSDRTSLEWAEYVCNWIDQYTCYRSERAVLEMFQKYFDDVSTDSDDYLKYRLENSKVPFKNHLLRFYRLKAIRKVIKQVYFLRGGLVVLAK